MPTEAAETRQFTNWRGGRRLSLVLGSLLALSTVYLASLLFGYVFGIGTVRRHHVESASYVFAAVWLITAARRSAHVRLDHGAPPRWLPLALIVMALSLYANTLFLGLFSDDFVLLQKALDHEWMAQAEFVRPVPLVAWNSLLAITSNPAVLHAFSIALHGVNAALVYSLALCLGLGTSRAAVAAALFAAFPASVEAVVWPAAVPDLLVATCALLFILLVRQQRSWLGLAAATLVLIVGLLSKESAVAIPFLAAVVWLRPRASNDSNTLRALLVGVAVCAVYVVVRAALVAVPDSFAQGPTRYMLKELIARPIGTLTIPWNTAVFQTWPVVPFLWAMGCIAAAATYAWSTPKAVPVQAVVRCVVAALVAVLPVYSMLFITPDLENARYLYLATAFWVITLASLASPPGGLTPGRGLVFGGAVAVAIVGVQVHLTAWRDAARIREQVLAAAANTLKTAQCSPVSFAGAPDSVRGAYLFRNGLSEAIAFRTGAMSAASTGNCTFMWNGSEFERSTNVRGPVQASMAR